MNKGISSYGMAGFPLVVLSYSHRVKGSSDFPSHENLDVPHQMKASENIYWLLSISFSQIVAPLKFELER